jgi:hypothetical protein
MTEYIRRKRTFPIYFKTVRTSRFGKPEMRLFYAHELAEYEAAQAAAAQAEAEAQIADACADSDPNAPGADGAQDPNEPPASPLDALPSEAYSIPLASLFPTPAIPSPPPDLARHARKCAVCSHPDRDAIEGDFVRWAALERIAERYKISDRSTLYRHAHATGLFVRRKQELGRVLESILEASETCTLDTADLIIRAARLYTHLDDYGRWFEPPRVQVVVAVPPSAVSVAPPPPPVMRQTAPAESDPQTSNRNIPVLEDPQVHENKG